MDTETDTETVHKIEGDGDIFVGWRFRYADVRAASRRTVVIEQRDTIRPGHYQPITLPIPIAGPMIRRWSPGRNKWYVVCGNCHMIASKFYTRANEPALHRAARDHRCEPDIPWDTEWMDKKDPTTPYNGDHDARPQQRELEPLERDILTRIIADIFHRLRQSKNHALDLDLLNETPIRMEPDELRILAAIREAIDPRDD